MDTSTGKSFIRYDRRHYTDEELITFYKALLKPRLIEEKMLILLRQGKISKWFSGIGQEAIAVGATLALEPDEYIFPLHRNLGVFTTRKVSLARLFAQFQGKRSGYTQARDRSFHFGSKEHHLVGMISHLGPQLSLADGVALAYRLENQKKVTLAFSGDGATSEGEFHEALNLAAVWDLPVIFLVENNGYGLSTPNYEQFKCEKLIQKASGYGMEALRLDGNDIIEVYHRLNQLADDLRYNPRPVLVEALTFRMRGHEEASGVKYVPQHLFEKWALKDPIGNYERYLLSNRIITSRMIHDAREQYKQEINEALAQAFEEEKPHAEPVEELKDVFAISPPFNYQPKNLEEEREIRLVDAIREGLWQSLEHFPKSVMMGQDIAEYGGVFKVSEGFVEHFGKRRIRNTPLCESAVIGAALGLSIAGWKAIVEMQFADFVSCGFNQIVNNLAKIHYRWGQGADVVIRMPTGGNVGAGPFHSQSNEAWFFHTPGLKIVYPSNPYDAKGLLNTAIADPNPYLFFEHKYLYRSLVGIVPEEYYYVEVGKAKTLCTGDEVSIITYGLGVHWAWNLVQELSLSGKVEILDLRSLIPLDREAIRKTVQKTGKVLVIHEDTYTGGIGAEIAAWIAEECFEYLDAPLQREASLDTPVPFAPELEKNFLPVERIRKKLNFLLHY